MSLFKSNVLKVRERGGAVNATLVVAGCQRNCGELR